MKKYIRGFTLIELMIVMTVIAILAAMVLFGLGGAQKAARDTQREQIIKGVQTALQSFASDNMGAYPTGADWATVTGPAGGGVSDATRLGTTYLPNALTDPGCGGASTDMRGDADGIPTGCTTAPIATYKYFTSSLDTKCTGAPYEITLAKESGGTLIFCGPK